MTFLMPPRSCTFFWTAWATIRHSTSNEAASTPGIASSSPARADSSSAAYPAAGKPRTMRARARPPSRETDLTAFPSGAPRYGSTHPERVRSTSLAVVCMAPGFYTYPGRPISAPVARPIAPRTPHVPRPARTM